MNEGEILTKSNMLRMIVPSDLEAIHNLHSFPETDKYNTLGIPESIEETQSIIVPWIAANKSFHITNYTFAIEDKLSNEFVGLFGLKLSTKKYRSGEVWYKILPKYWNRGIATEALNGVLDFAFRTLKLHRIQAGCAVENIGSIKVLEKAGMIREGRRRQILPLKTGWSDNYEYAILGTDRHS